MTRLAIALGVVAIGIGIADPRLYQINIVVLVAVAAVALSVAGILTLFWRINLRSRRWGDARFWLSLVINLLLIATVSFFYYRGMDQKPYRSTGAPLSTGTEVP
jgi:uncharacterized membrane protein HdeD (DUF308 family)